MAVENHIESLKSLNSDGSFTTLPVIPRSLTDGTYKITLPTLTANSTIALVSDLARKADLSGANFTGEITIPNATYIKSFKTGGSTTAYKIIGVNSSNNILLGDVQYPETRVFTQILRVPYKPTDTSSYPSGGYSLGTSEYPWTKIYGTTIYENGESLSSKYQLHAQVDEDTHTLKLL